MLEERTHTLWHSPLLCALSFQDAFGLTASELFHTFIECSLLATFLRLSSATLLLSMHLAALTLPTEAAACFSEAALGVLFAKMPL